MKYSEFHKIIKKNGWIKLRQKGSHIIYTKDGKHYVVENHGSNEMSKRTEMKNKKEMGLKY